VLVRPLVTVLLVGALIAVLFALWQPGTEQERSLIPANVTFYAPGVTRQQLAACQQLWDGTAGLSVRSQGFTSYLPPKLLDPFLHAARRLARADTRPGSDRAFQFAPLLSYLEACRSLPIGLMAIGGAVSLPKLGGPSWTTPT
jgi:hypothetical protein